jgi:hypothetical protein
VAKAVEPTERRIRILARIRGSPLYERWKSGQFSVATDDQMIQELGTFAQGLTFDCIIETLYMTNVFCGVRGPLCAKRNHILAPVVWYRSLSSSERLRFRLHRYVCRCYLQIVSGQTVQRRICLG